MEVRFRIADIAICLTREYLHGSVPWQCIFFSFIHARDLGYTRRTSSLGVKIMLVFNFWPGLAWNTIKCFLDFWGNFPDCPSPQARHLAHLHAPISCQRTDLGSWQKKIPGWKGLLSGTSEVYKKVERVWKKRGLLKGAPHHLMKGIISGLSGRSFFPWQANNRKIGVVDKVSPLVIRSRHCKAC